MISPIPLRLAVLLGYCYVWFLGFKALTLKCPEYTQWALVGVEFMYIWDSIFAGCPLQLCNMRLPPDRILKHHVPFALALLPNVFFIFYFNEAYTKVLPPFFSLKSSNLSVERL
jgi:hypothetical protein